MSTTPIILASGSPRRKELMASAGFEFDVIPPTVDEASIDVSGQSPEQLVRTLATEKAYSIAIKHPEKLVIGSDTVVVLDGEILGKPKDEDDAFAMLKKLQGTRHQVVSGVAVFGGNKSIAAHATTHVWMDPLDDGQIKSYIATGEPLDKAGAYAIQGRASVWIPKIEGCYFNVVGLPLHLLSHLLQQQLSFLKSPIAKPPKTH